ncbi:MAG: 3-phosphoshikimate 1-carboxyvinyltransferase [Acholeplasmataceae bacterium]|nr:3-phosphoshikimate 1-carboxyvinyltransferase [Acholeplasmataceae bacterium]
MKIRLRPSQLFGTLPIIASKSLSHRYLIAAGLAEGESTIHNILDAEDIEATRHALKALNVKFDGNKVIGGQFKLVTSTTNIKASGSTLRFMIPIFMLQANPVTLIGDKRFFERSLQPYEEVFFKKGLDIAIYPHDESFSVTVKGPLINGTYHLKGDVSSQFVTGLLFALPLLNGDSEIIFTSKVVSGPYIDLTLLTLDHFGIVYELKKQAIYIPGKQKYHPQNLFVEGDYSQAAFWFVAGTIQNSNKPLQLLGLNPNSKQGDKQIVEIITNMGGRIIYDENNDSYLVYPKKTASTTIDLQHIPDLGPILMVLAAVSEGITYFKNTERLRIKESDRFAVMVHFLEMIGIHIKTDKNEMLITGQKQIMGNFNFDAPADHRIIMALTILSLKIKGEVIIQNAHHIQKSYPTFFQDFKKLGGHVDEIT